MEKDVYKTALDVSEKLTPNFSYANVTDISNSFSDDAGKDYCDVDPNLRTKSYYNLRFKSNQSVLRNDVCPRSFAENIGRSSDAVQGDSASKDEFFQMEMLANASEHQPRPLLLLRQTQWGGLIVSSNILSPANDEVSSQLSDN